MFIIPEYLITRRVIMCNLYHAYRPRIYYFPRILTFIARFFKLEKKKKIDQKPIEKKGVQKFHFDVNYSRKPRQNICKSKDGGCCNEFLHFTETTAHPFARNAPRIIFITAINVQRTSCFGRALLVATTTIVCQVPDKFVNNSRRVLREEFLSNLLFFFSCFDFDDWLIFV